MEPAIEYFKTTNTTNLLIQQIYFVVEKDKQQWSKVIPEAVVRNMI